MTLLIYFIFRLLLLVAVAMGSGQLVSQSAPKDAVPRKEIPVQQSDSEIKQLLEVTLDSTLKAVEELKELPKTSEKVIQKNKKLLRKLDNIYYGTILPLKYMSPRKTSQSKINLRGIGLIEPQPPLLETKCVTLPEVTTPEFKKPGFLKRIFRKK